MTETSFGRSVDVTDATEWARDLLARRVDAPFRELADHLPTGLFVLDRSPRLVFANRALAELVGPDGDDPPDRAAERAGDLDGAAGVVHPDDLDRALGTARRVLARAEPRVLDCRLVAPTGSVRQVRCHLAPVSEEGVVVGLVGTVADHTEAERQLHRLATHDEPTGLPNRALLGAHLEAALLRAAIHGGATCVLFVGLQRVGVVSDALGHAAGDRLVRLAARRLVATVGPEPFVSRFAEDRFVVVVEDLPDPTAAAHLGPAVVEAMSAPFDLGDDEAFIGAAVGIAASAAGEGSVDQLVSDAGVAMARAADAGQPIEVFDAAMRERVEARRTLELALRRGLERGEFGLAYQPIVALADGRILGFEALARWIDAPAPDMGPAQFVPVAEDAGLIVALGEDLLVRACGQLARWQAVRPGLFVSVNLSARQLAEPDLPAVVEDALRRAGADPSGLHLEITETVLLEDVDTAVASLQQLKLTGVHLCLDDFGTGYSSLTYLCRLPVDVVKIDRSFVSGLGTSERDSSVVAAIVGMAGSLGHDIVAEGVETADQAERLRALGCRMAQGHLYSRPVLARWAEAMLLEGA